MANSNAGFILCLILISFAVVPSLATDYTVGDSTGWALGVDYTTWTAGKSFIVGDNLVFKYTSSHTVDEVGSTDYNACNSANAISSDSTGSTSVPLKTAGTHYFICGSMGHCAGGMKMAVTVASGSGSGAGGAPTSPSTGNGGSIASPETPTTGSPATPTVTPTTPGTTSTHPSSSGSLSPITSLFFTFGAVMAKLVLS